MSTVKSSCIYQEYNLEYKNKNEKMKSYGKRRKRITIQDKIPIKPVGEKNRVSCIGKR
jgi:hypothetical protein